MSFTPHRIWHRSNKTRRKYSAFARATRRSSQVREPEEVLHSAMRNTGFISCGSKKSEVTWPRSWFRRRGARFWRSYVKAASEVYLEVSGDRTYGGCQDRQAVTKPKTGHVRPRPPLCHAASRSSSSRRCCQQALLATALVAGCAPLDVMAPLSAARVAQWVIQDAARHAQQASQE